jgi:uncharacterized protein
VVYFQTIWHRRNSLLALLLVPSFAMAADASSAHIVQLLELNGTLRAARETAEQVVNQLRAGNPSMPPEVWARYTELVTDKQTLIEAYAPIYGRHLNAEDVLGVLEFYTSPLGSRWRQALPQIAAETRQGAQQFVAGVAADLADQGSGAPATDAASVEASQPSDPRAQEVARLLRASGALGQARLAMTNTLERLRKQGNL